MIVVALLLSPLLSLALARAIRPLLKWLRPVEGVLAADNLIQAPRRTSASVAALMLSLTLDEMLEIPAPNGLIRLPIACIIVDYSDQQGTIFIDRSLFRRCWSDDSVDVFRVYLKPGARVPDVRQRILEKYAGHRQVFVLTNAEIRSYILKVTGLTLGFALGAVGLYDILQIVHDDIAGMRLDYEFPFSRRRRASV
ncbi:MAG: hypothetical protein HY047_15390 [Acidobacteria bacterium]|nr:hypothetical protein [Acidobacteriota bacterium]